VSRIRKAKSKEVVEPIVNIFTFVGSSYPAARNQGSCVVFHPPPNALIRTTLASVWRRIVDTGTGGPGHTARLSLLTALDLKPSAAVLMADSKPVGKLQVCQREWGAISRARHHIAGEKVPNTNVRDKRLVINVFGRGIEAAANAVM
jgi:hypothetical protein